MGIVSRIKREVFIHPWLKQGYSRKLANAYYRNCIKDNQLDNGISAADKKWAHDNKYLSTSIEKYDLKNNMGKYITDVDYLFLQPFNNSFTKWMRDYVTSNHVFVNYPEHLPKLYFNIIDRENKKVFLPIDTVNREYGETYEDFIKLLNERGELVIRPALNTIGRSAYTITCVGEGAYKLGVEQTDRQHKLMFGNDYDMEMLLCEEYPEELPEGFEPNPAKKAVYDKDSLYALISTLKNSYVISEPYKRNEPFKGIVKLYICNEELETTDILDAYFLPETDGKSPYKRIGANGEIEGSDKVIPNWDKLTDDVKELAHFVSEIEFFNAYIVITEDGFIIDRFSTKPVLPEVAHSDKMNNYLLNRLEEKKKTFKVTRENRWKAFWNKRFNRWVRRRCRPGIRPYMQKLWMKSVWDDFRHTKTTTLGQKIWCWKRGFQSFRIQQYGLTKDNYTNFLSDYQYHWLNRINNAFQIWINDKTTTRYVMEPCKEYLAKYYFDIIKMHGKTCIKTLQDVPEGTEASFDGIFKLLREEKLLALKPSSGTHGDGFYRMEYADGKYLINGKEMTEQEIIDMISAFKSIYIITEYLFMHKELKKIYPNSVNTIRVAVVNQTAYEPKIMQAYMRIGSSHSGFTDNVGYGGICTKINLETGEYYCPEQIHDHKFTPCPVHPDTGVEINGIIPNWDYMCKGLIGICKFMPELEYLGFDIAITDDGFKIIEINIHQDLHKVAEHSEQFKQFYRDKLKLKAEQYGLTKY